MKELHFEYCMSLSFTPPVSDHHFTLKCMPQSTRCQEIMHLETEIFPKKFSSPSRDSFGNLCIYGHEEQEHDHFSVRVTGIAHTGLAPWETADEVYQIGIFKRQTAKTCPGSAIRSFHDLFSFAPEVSMLEKAGIYMNRLYQALQYVQGATTVQTTAEEAMLQKKGVCQDYSHILLSLCRMESIPARYVVGMLSGEGLSHAWVEVFDHGRWIGLDPTNNLFVQDQHIKISVGRDYHDCMINQGIFTGQTTQTQTVRVSVWETDQRKER